MFNTVLCYIERDGKYLMLYRNRKKNDVNAGKYIGVGGKFEAGESPEECLLREVKEETGLTLRSYAFRGVVTFVFDGESEYMFLYTADGFEGTLTDCNEGELHWIDKDALPSLALWEGDRLFLELLRQGARPFSMKLVYDRDSRLLSSHTEFL